MQNANGIGSSQTIHELEEKMASAIERLAELSEESSQSEMHNVLRGFKSLFCPAGLRPVVQLEQDGRKKRNSGPASGWTFATGEIVVYFDEADMLLTDHQVQSGSLEGERVKQAPVELGDDSSEVKECCEALAEAEALGRQFIAFTWFRDLALPAKPFPWSRDPVRRQQVLASAIASGAIQTQRIPNPKSPMHPTTTVKLNRTSSPITLKTRFNPVPVRGESVSATLLHDRG